jgi:hypothetical protein
MTPIRLENGLPFVSATIAHGAHRIVLETVLVDTGSAGTAIAADLLTAIGLRPEPDDVLRRLRGIGGVEYVFTKRVDALHVGTLALPDFQVECGDLRYGFALDAILGTDFLSRVGAVVDFRRLEIRHGDA